MHDLNWFKASQGDAITENDQIFTGTNSFTQLDLNDGNKFYIEKNSLINLLITINQQILN